MHELVARVTNAGAVESPSVTVRAYVDGMLAGESVTSRVEGQLARDFLVPFAADAGTPRPFGYGHLVLRVVGPGGAVVAVWPDGSAGGLD